MSLKESAYHEEFISFEEQIKEIRAQLEDAKQRCDGCLKSTKEKKLWLCGCCGDKILMCVEEVKQKLHEVRKMLDLN